jgi:hypothetical protein
MALTLADMGALAETKLRQGVIYGLAKATRMGQLLPFVPTEALDATVVYISGYPALSWRNVGGTPAESKATFAQRTEALKALSAKITVDRLVLKAKNLVQDLRASQIKAHTEALAFEFNDTFINGDPTADASSPAGIRYRMQNEERFTNQILSAGAAYDVDADSAHIHTWLDLIDEGFDRVGNEPSAIICNRQTKRKLAGVARREKLFDVTKDMFDREIERYRGVPIVDIGPNRAGAHKGAAYATTDQILLHNGYGASSNASEMYIVRFGEDDLCGIQNGDVVVENFVKDPGSPQNLVAYIEWVCSIAIFRPDAVVCLKELVI